MTRPSRDQVCMAHARVAALRGTCSRALVGVAIAQEGRILVTGYNGAPAGMAHCNHTDHELLPSGCRLAVHAEANAIAWAARWGIALDGTTMYTTHMACLACAQLIINAGIVKVVAQYPYRDPSGLNLLLRAGIKVDSEVAGEVDQVEPDLI